MRRKKYNKSVKGTFRLPAEPPPPKRVRPDVPTSTTTTAVALPSTTASSEQALAQAIDLGETIILHLSVINAGLVIAIQVTCCLPISIFSCNSVCVYNKTCLQYARCSRDTLNSLFSDPEAIMRDAEAALRTMTPTRRARWHQFFRLVISGGFPNDHIAEALFLDVITAYSLTDRRGQRFSKEIKLFFRVMRILGTNQLLHFLRGSASSPLHTSINLAVPTDIPLSDDIFPMPGIMDDLIAVRRCMGGVEGSIASPCCVGGESSRGRA